MSEQQPTPELSLEEKRDNVIGNLLVVYAIHRDLEIHDERAWKALSPLLDALWDVQLQIDDEHELSEDDGEEA